MDNTLYSTDGSTIEHGFEVLMTPKDAATILCINVRTLTAWARAGKVRSVKTEGGHRRYYAASIRAAHEGRWKDAAEKPNVEDMNPNDVAIVVPED
jgi:excisionase family DNA binding protein